ncbi:carboxypeptidase N subunit 2-like [Tribolium madens]|uniref:carboxypeptidase N subunit 2-like n=1 Tax=Tribolium madens TaxID=41895 RepID=UPI001CF735F7|nr:carboxypeptidase N subunit 2-like [Tribolium madens]
MVTLLCLVIVLFVSQTQSVTYENVTILLTTRQTIYYINDTIPPTKLLQIRCDNTLVEYVNNQPWEIVKIQYQNVPNLSKNAVSHLPNVTEVGIISSGLEKIEPRAFGDLPKMEFLYINENPLKEVQNGVFANLSQLTWLHLENNSIETLGDKVFNDLPSLRHVFLDGNRISTWRSDWFAGSPVESISMSFNSIEELPSDMFEYYHKFNDERPSRLWYLILESNKVRKIHPDAFRGLKELDYLNLKNNSIKELPSGVFGTITYINNFELSDNLIKNIDPSIFNNTSLSYVKLRNNRLSCLPLELVNVTEIYNVNIDGNPVSCNCVKSWKTWQEEYKKEILSLGDIEQNCTK